MQAWRSFSYIMHHRTSGCLQLPWKLKTDQSGTPRDAQSLKISVTDAKFKMNKIIMPSQKNSLNVLKFGCVGVGGTISLYYNCASEFNIY